MSKLIFFGLPAHGHTNPTLGVIRELIARGEKVVYYNTEEFQSKVESVGARFQSYGRIPPHLQDPDLKNPLRVFALLLECTRLILADCLPEVRKEQPDYIIHDSFCQWGRYMAEILGVPAISSISTFVLNPRILFSESPMFALQMSGKFLGGSGRSGFKEYQRLRQILRENYQIRPARFPEIVCSQAGLNIVYTSREFQPASQLLDDSFCFVGPSITPRNETHNLPLFKMKNRKIIYISLGTLLTRQTEFFQKCLLAFRDTDYQVYMSIGRGTDIKTLGEIPPNFFIRQYMPQLEILTLTDLFITHGGMNSVSEGLYYGVPLIVLPGGGDQPIVARQVCRLGAGICHDLQTVTPEQLRRTVDQIITDPQYRQNSLRIGTSFKQVGGAPRAAKEILEYIAKRRK